MGFFTIVKHRLAPPVLKSLNRYVSFRTRIAKADICLRFVEDCISNSIYPVSYWKSLRRARIRPDNICLKRLALSQMETTRVKRDELNRGLSQLTAVINSLSERDRAELETLVNEIIAKQGAKLNASLSKTLKGEKPTMCFPAEPEKYVCNLSCMTLDRTTMEVLSLGPKFCLPTRRDNRLAIEAQFENLYRQTSQLSPTSDSQVEEFKSLLVHACYQYRRARITHKTPVRQEHIQALHNLVGNKDILLTRPDKGAGIVVLNKADYLRKMHEILADDTKFSKIIGEKDKTKQIENQICNSLKKLRDEGFISEGVYENLRPVGTAIPRLYGLPKTHKPNVPLRPVLDMKDSPYHSTARWLVELLEPVRKQVSVHSLKDSFEFVELVRDRNVTDLTMCSLDVASLFTNVPLFETINYICDYIDQNQISIGIPTVGLKELLLRCTFNIQFLFNGEIYRQHDGVAMGSPLGPFLADVFMGMLEQSKLRSVIESLSLYCRYVDDIFILLHSSRNIEDLTYTFNQAHTALKFTSEVEEDRSFHFLDVNMKRLDDGSLQRGVYRKRTWNGQYTNFYSFVPLRSKRNLIFSLTSRAERICSNDTLSEELQRIRLTLKENGYPDGFIKANMEPRRKSPVTLTAEKKPIFLQLPYKGEIVAEVLSRRISRALRHTFPAAKMQIHFTSSPMVKTNPKDKRPVHANSMCVYSFTCSCGSGYIGRTTRRLSDRVREHHPAWLATGCRKLTNSSIATHLADTDHSPNLAEAFKVIYRPPANRSKCVRMRLLESAESLAIRLYEPELCVQKRFTHTLCLTWPRRTTPSIPRNCAHATTVF
ncbi:unnamed protein product [Dicrocoelium dendriticum]|nr:unnamed protein product [Dicrocoelium dendriticum]